MGLQLASPPVPRHLHIHGGSTLNGDVTASGFKHSLVTTVAAAMAAGAPLELSNCPNITETHVLAALIDQAGGSVSMERDRLTIDPEHLRTGELDDELSSLIHGSPYLAPSLLRRFGQARINAQGGCRIGNGTQGRRPVAHYVDILQRFGVSAEVDADGSLTCRGDAIRGCEIDLQDYKHDRFGPLGNLYSGATKMALLTAAVAQGLSILKNPYMKADVLDLIAVLRRAGIAVERNNKDLVVTCHPNARLPAIQYTLPPDLIEIVSWITAAAIAADRPFVVRSPGMRRAAKELRCEIELVERMGVGLELADTSLTIHPKRPLRPAQVQVNHDASIFSDSQPFIALMSTFAEGTSQIADHVWPNRFAYVAQLNRLGTDITVQGNRATINGVRPPAVGGQTVHGADLRSSAVLALAALCVDGVTVLTGAEHLDRGYADLPGALRSAGVTVESIGGTQVSDGQPSLQR